MSSIRVGDLEVFSVSDGRLLAPWPETYPEGPDVAEHQYATDDGRIILSVGGFVVRSGDRVVLIDAGAGPPVASARRSATSSGDGDDHLRELLRHRGLDDDGVEPEARAAGAMAAEHGTMPAGLAALGITPADITDVVFTHLHFDHIGWASTGGMPYFPNATYRCARPDVDFFCGPAAVDETYFTLVFGAMTAGERLAPVLDRLEPWDGDGALMAGVDVILAPGHTPGSAVVVLSSGPYRALLLGDVVHCPLELTDEDFVFLGDMDPEVARRTRDRFRRELNGGDVLAAGAHFPELRFGRLVPGMGRRSWRNEA